MKGSSSPTEQLLGIVGSPFVAHDPNSSVINVSELYYYAAKNRMRLLYLEALRKIDMLGVLEKKHAELTNEYTKTENAICRVSEVLDNAGFHYTFFKSIRPYREVTVDLDILILDSAYYEVVQALQNHQYAFLGNGPLSTTLRDSKTRINLDIYNEVGVSHLIYLDKKKLVRFVDKRQLSNGADVSSLSPEADLLALIAHSIIKEQMYVLSEYYTTLHYLSEMKPDALDSLLSLVNECKIHSAAETHLWITAFLHHHTYDMVPASLGRLLKVLHADSLELSHVIKQNFIMPHKFHLLTSTKALIEKLGEEKARLSFASQTTHMLDPRFAASVLGRALHYISRETY